MYVYVLRGHSWVSLARFFPPCVQHLDFVDDDAVHLDPPRYSLRTSVLSNATPDIVKGTKGTLQLLIISSACTASSL